MSSNPLSMLQRRFACARLSHPHMTQSLPRLLTMTLTTAAFDRSSSWQFEASPYKATSKGAFLAQLRKRTEPLVQACRATPDPAMSAAGIKRRLLRNDPDHQIMPTLALSTNDHCPPLSSPFGCIAALR
jgi:hypothetical protein